MLVPTIAIFAALVVVVAGGLIVWSNPSRSVNRAVFAGTLQMAAWLVSWHMAATASDGLFWLKWTCAIGALAPLNFWIVKECIRDDPSGSFRGWLRRSAPWIVWPALLAVIPFTDFFIPPTSTKARPIYGWGYYAYIWGLLCLYGILFRDASKKMKSLSGGARLELQVWLGGGCILAVTIYLLMALSAITKDPSYRRLQPLAMLLFYAGTAYAVTSHRIFDARQIMLVCLEKTTLIICVAGAVVLLNLGFGALLPNTFALLATTVIGLWLAAALDARLNRFFQLYPQETTARHALLRASRQHTRVDNLERAFSAVLQGWGQTDHVLILSGGKDGMRSAEVEIAADSPILVAMHQLRWVTPERLERERRTPARVALRDFLLKNRLGVLVIDEGPALTVMIGVGTGASRRPFTYPQVTQLLEFTSIIEGTLERAHFSAKAQHSEQLATVGLLGASLAHEIRNPLVSIKTFVQLLPTHHQDSAFREKFCRLIGDEVGRIDQLTEQLLDLAAPRTYSAQLIELHPVLRASLDLVAAKAAHRDVRFVTDFQAVPDQAYTDASAAKQVMLNLCFNAIQAVDNDGSGDRWVRIATRNTVGAIEMAVTDSGPGISADIRPKLFQPFQTTKSTGFGLGLAICSDILANLNASISVDPPVPGQGATFRVTFPCQPLSS